MEIKKFNMKNGKIQFTFSSAFFSSSSSLVRGCLSSLPKLRAAKETRLLVPPLRDSSLVWLPGRACSSTGRTSEFFNRLRRPDSLCGFSLGLILLWSSSLFLELIGRVTEASFCTRPDSSGLSSTTRMPVPDPAVDGRDSLPVLPVFWAQESILLMVFLNERTFVVEFMKEMISQQHQSVDYC